MIKSLHRLRHILAAAIITALMLQSCSLFKSEDKIPVLDAQREQFIESADSRVVEETAGINNNQIRETDGNALIAVDYPSYSANEQISAAVYEYITGIVEEFKQEALSMGDPTDESGLYTLSITYKPYVTDNIIGFKFVENMFSGKTETTDHITTMNFDKATGDEADISRFFNPSTSYLNTLADTVRDYINRNYDFGENKNEELFKEGTAPNIQDYSNFVVAPGHKFIFYFNAGEIAEADAGMVQAAIPMSDLKNVLNAELKELYNPTPLPISNNGASQTPEVSSEPSFTPLEPAASQ